MLYIKALWLKYVRCAMKRSDNNAKCPTIKLNNGNDIPAIGMGTMFLEHGGDLQTIIDNAIACGYRLFDGAALYEMKSSWVKRIRKTASPARSCLSAASSKTAGIVTTTP